MPDLNATNSIYSLMNVEPSSWGGTVIYLFLFILLPIALVAIAFFILWDIVSYTRFKKYLGSIQNSFIYFGIGACSLVIIAIPFVFLYWGYTLAKKGNIVPLRYAGYIILGYIGISTFGWIINKYVIKRVQKFEKILKENKRRKHNEYER